MVAAVLALAEPYRSAVLLRYYEELPPRAIARRLGVPVETVRTRVKRGVELIRMRLVEARSFDARALIAWLLPMARSRTPWLPLAAKWAGIAAAGLFLAVVVGNDRGVTLVDEKPASLIHPEQSAPV